MKKLLRILFVKREETKNKWWDRLFHVLLGGTSILLLLLAIFLTLESTNNAWVSYRPVAFSLEPNYEQAQGKEVLCEPTLESWNDKGVKCGEVILSDQELARYYALRETASERLWKQSGLDGKYVADCAKFPLKAAGSNITLQKIAAFDQILGQDSATTQMSAEERAGLACWKNNLIAEHADPAYSAYQTALDNLNDNKVKLVGSTNFGLVFDDIASWTLIPILVVLLWVLFWSSVVYRATLYVIYGKKAKNS